MNAVQCLWLVFPLVAGCAATGSKPVDCCPEVCVLENETCTSPAAGAVYLDVVCGKSDPSSRLDPLCIPSVHREEGQISYPLNNVQVKGLCDCRVKKLKLDTNNITYEYHLNCPKLSISYEVETSDNSCSGPITVGVSLTICDYEIKDVGTYGIYISQGDNLPHFYLQNVCTTVKLVGVVEYSVSATCNSRPTTAAGRLESQILGDVAIIMKKSSNTYIIGINDNIRKRSLGAVLPSANSSGRCPSI